MRDPFSPFYESLALFMFAPWIAFDDARSGTGDGSEE